MATIRTLQKWFQPHAQALLDVARDAGLNPQVTSAYRSRAEQGRLYRNYLAGKSRFPAAAPGKSRHESGVAFDIHISDARYLTDLGHLWESWGGVWGGRFKDPIHFEAPR